jgi:hypothetical protein
VDEALLGQRSVSNALNKGVVGIFLPVIPACLEEVGGQWVGVETRWPIDDDILVVRISKSENGCVNNRMSRVRTLRFDNLLFDGARDDMVEMVQATLAISNGESVTDGRLDVVGSPSDSLMCYLMMSINDEEFMLAQSFLFTHCSPCQVLRD